MGKENKAKKRISCTSLFRKIDMFGVPIKWTIKGKENFQTTDGSIFTLIFVTALASFGLDNLLKVITMSDPDIKSYE
jgi:hypothetical protein